MGNVFSAYDIRGRAGESLTTDYVWNIGKAVADWLQDDGSLVVMRSDGAHEPTVHAFIEGVLLQGSDVVDAGQGDKDALAGAIHDTQALGGVLFEHDALQSIEVITFFDSQGTVITADSGLTSIAELAEAGNFVPAAQKGDLKKQ